MNIELPREITQEEIETYHRDGVVLLEGMFDDGWIELLKQGLHINCEKPTRRARTWDRDSQNRTMFWDSQAWRGIKEYQQFIFHSPAAQLAGKLLRSKEINFFFDAVFVRSPGAQFSTPWHQDEPYWSIEGYDTCTIWMPLVPVKKESALAYVPGSHLSSQVFDQYNFGDLNPDGKTDVDQVNFSGIAEESIPDIDENPERYGVVSWDMEPGDCIAFNSRILHGGSGKLAEDQDLRVFTSKWVGDDVRIKFRECGMDPDHSDIMTQYGLKPGERLGTELYPRVWPKS
ncbi:MAG: hypothetical protein GKR95_00500 [Gammaproteobacteria bacterium]|nr:hypothetical protein [Gammaproteobacteria bacterium]